MRLDSVLPGEILEPGKVGDAGIKSEKMGDSGGTLEFVHAAPNRNSQGGFDEKADALAGEIGRELVLDQAEINAATVGQLPGTNTL